MSRIFTIIATVWSVAVIFLAAGCRKEIKRETGPVRELAPRVLSSTSTAPPSFTEDIGFYITGENDHAVYPGTSAGILSYVSGSWKASPGTYVNGTPGRLYAWYPSDLILSPDNSGGNHTVPVSVPAEQTSAGTGAVTDYLYGAGSGDAASTEPIVVSSRLSPTVYMQHALAQVVFTVQGDRRDPGINDYVKSITLSASGNQFLSGDGSLNVRTGGISGLTGTQTLTFYPETPAQIGGTGAPVTVAEGLVAPLASAPAVTLTVVLGPEDSDAENRTYTLTSTSINVKWERGRSYLYSLTLGNEISVTQTAVIWGTAESDSGVDFEEQGIGSENELRAFTELWNAHGDQGVDNAEFYKDYGWEENGVFMVKITKDIVITAGQVAVPLGTEDNPLTIPFDGQGWDIGIDVTGTEGGSSSGTLSAPCLIGYTKNDVRNVRIFTFSNSPSGGVQTLELNSETYAGLLAGKVEGNIENCTVELNDMTLSCNMTGTESYFGGLVGYCTGTIRNSAVYAPMGSTLTLEAASGNRINMGGLVGGVIMGSGLSNCYVRITGFTGGSGVMNVDAGVLVKDDEGYSDIQACHYFSDYTFSKLSDVSLPVSGAEPRTDFTGLCDELNSLAQSEGWEQWTEETGDTGTAVERVRLFKYRDRGEDAGTTACTLKRAGGHGL